MRVSAVAVAALVLAAGFSPAGRAGVRAVPHPSQGWSIELDTDGGRPWTPVPGHDVSVHVLNPGGDLSADGAPATGVRPIVGLPEAVWSAALPTGYELLHARHDGERWGRPEPLTFDAFSQDVRPVLGWDDHGRSLLAWKKIGSEVAIHVAGLSIESRLWGERLLEGPGWSPIAIGTDGDTFLVASVHRSGGRVRFQRVAFPFPDGGPALPFPDDSLLVRTASEETVGPDDPALMGMGGGGPDLDDEETADLPATVAANTLLFHRHEDLVWADWVSPDSTIRWVAFRDGEFVERGAEPFNGPNQSEPARQRVRRTVEEL